MTLGDAISEVLMHLEQRDLVVSVSRPTIRLFMNEALQFTKLLAEQSDPSYYTASQSFSGGSVANPSHFKELIYVYVPTATDGQAIILSNRQEITVGANSISKGTTANPTCVQDTGVIRFTPASTGTLFFLTTFGEYTQESDESTDLTTLVPWTYEELVILKTVEFILLRHYMIPRTPTDLQESIARYTEGFAQLYKQFLPGEQARQEIPKPATQMKGQ